MMNRIKNFVLGAVMAIGVMAASLTAMAGTQYVQTDMNFRAGTSTSATIIGSVPAGAQVEVLGSKNGWDLITYNGRTGYIHGGNTGATYTAPKAPVTVQAQTFNSTTAAAGTVTVKNLQEGYLAIRTAPAFQFENEIGKLYNGMKVQITGGTQNGYVWVFSPDLGISGYVNQNFVG